ncbi:unnamed protein product [Toxocara canis]|uniref:Nucleolar protein dao-5-like n=1 Tax=Toxocara canis TaxID=6265 RepID=A0A183V828_TOXCA|nr:unnamed protein product [Toxocara canis]
MADQKAGTAAATDQKADKESDQSGDKIKPNSANVQKSEKPQTGEQRQQTANAVEQPQQSAPTTGAATPAQNETPKIEKTVIFSLSDGSGSKKSEENKEEAKIFEYSKGETKSPTKVNEGESDDKTSGPDETQRTVATTAETQATDLVSTFDTENRTQKSELSIRMSETDGNEMKKKPEERSTSKAGDKPLSRSEGKKADKEGLSNSDEKKSKAERPENMEGSWKEGDLRKKVKSKSKKGGQLKGGDTSKREYN